jgi:hypothetical protein
MHAKIQIDPSDQVGLREGPNGTIEIVIISDDEASCVVELSRRQLADICEEASEA